MSGIRHITATALLLQSFWALPSLHASETSFTTTIPLHSVAPILHADEPAERDLPDTPGSPESKVTAKLKAPQKQCGRQTKYVGRFRSTHACAAAAAKLQNVDCTTFMFSSYTSWGCRCCDSSEPHVDHSLWSIYTIEVWDSFRAATKSIEHLVRPFADGGLGSAMRANKTLTRDVFHLHRQLFGFVVEDATDAERQEVFTWYEKHVEHYSSYFTRRRTEDLVDWLAAQVWINMLECGPRSKEHRVKVNTAILAAGDYKYMLEEYGMLLIENNRALQRETSLIRSFFDATNPKHYHCELLSMKGYLSNNKDTAASFTGLRSGANTFNGAWYPENAYPSDCQVCNVQGMSPRMPAFASALAHEVMGHQSGAGENRLAEAYNPDLKVRQRKIIANGKGPEPNLNNLRVGPGKLKYDFFVKNPQEHYASFTNQYYTDSELTLRFAVERAQKGYLDNLDQFLLGAYYLSMGGNDLRFFRINWPYDGIHHTQVKLRRNSQNHIIGIDGPATAWKFDWTVDNEGFVKSCCDAWEDTSPTTTSTTYAGTSTTAPEGMYFGMPMGSCCCSEEERISTEAECEKAHDALGLQRGTPWRGAMGSIPGGCSTRQRNNHNLHWNSVELGSARSDMTPICKRLLSTTSATVTSTTIAATTTGLRPTTVFTSTTATTTAVMTTLCPGFIDGLTCEEAATFNPALSSYWDQRSCGNLGDDYEWQRCGATIGQCPQDVPVDSSLCQSKRMQLDFIKRNSRIAGCHYFYYAQYVCQDLSFTTSFRYSSTTSTATFSTTRSSTSDLATIRSTAAPSTAAPPTVTTTTSSPNSEKVIRSGDAIFLKMRSGSGNYLDVQGVAVQARWQSQGNWQAIVIEKERGGTIQSGDVVYLKAHTGANLDVVDGVVQARWADMGTWQAMTIEKRSGGGVILSDDIICLRAHTGKHLDVQDALVRARWSDCGDWQAIRVEREESGALFSGDSINLLAHTGNLIEVDGEFVGARWPEAGGWQTFTIENYGGRVISSGDVIFLKAHTGSLVHVQDTAVLAMWSDYGEWQSFTMQKKNDDGPIMPGDRIFLRGHTGRYVEVEGDAVQARWVEQGEWQSLVVQKSARRLIENSQRSILV